MENYRRILAAVDFSKYSEPVIKHASMLASGLNSELFVLHVINQRDVDTVKYTFEKLRSLTSSVSLESLLKKMKKDRESKMNNLIKIEDTSCIETRSIIRTGIPELEISNTAREIHADLVVIGKKGRGDLVDTLIGSVTQKMMRRCPMPLLVVRLKE